MKRPYNKKSEYWNNLSRKQLKNEIQDEPVIPVETSIASSSSRSFSKRTVGRDNFSALGGSLGEDYPNIKNLTVPWEEKNGKISISEVIELIEKAWCHFGVFRNTVEIMAEFGSAKIHLRGGNATSRKFIQTWFDKIGIKKLSENFFREYFRSGNVFLYKLEGKFIESDWKALRSIYGKELSESSVNKVPLRYVVLDPKSISNKGSASFETFNYVKILSQYEVQKLKKRETEEDILIYNSLPEATKKQIDNSTYSNDGVDMKLDSQKVYAIFYKKQDYEPFAVPFGFPVLKDLDRKEALKNTDQEIVRTINNVILLVTTGEKKDQFNNGGVSQKSIEAIRGMFENQSVTKVIVADYTTEAKFVIPEISNILDPKKYEVINNDIKEGLLNLAAGTEEKFSNQLIKIKVFTERLKEGRKVFLEDFLQREIKILCKNFGFKNYPEAFFEEIDLEDKTQMARVYTRFAELGFVTPEQLFSLMKSGVLPEDYDIEAAQTEFVERRKKGFFNPIVGGQPMIPQSENESQEKSKLGLNNPNTTTNGRPEGSTAKYSLSKIKDTYWKFNNLLGLTEASLKKKYQVKRLNAQQKSVAFDLAATVIQYNKANDWQVALNEYLDNPEKTLSLSKDGVYNETRKVADEHSINFVSAALLRESKCEE